MNISNKKFLKIKYIIMKSMYKKNIIYIITVNLNLI